MTPVVVDLPVGWKPGRVKDVASFSASTIDKKEHDGQIAVRLCNYVDVYYNDRITGDLNFMAATASATEIARFSVRAGDVAITKDSETAADIGIPAYVPEDLPGVVYGYHLYVLRPRSDHSGRYLKWLFDSDQLRAELATRANGLTRVGLGQGALGSLPIPIPPVDEQRRIAEFLDRETAQIDELIAKQEQLISTLAERRATEASELLRAQVTATDQPRVRAKTLWRVIDERAAGLDLPLLSVSIHDGVRRRDEVTDDLPRAEDLSNYKTCFAGDIVINRMRAFQGALGLAPIAGLVSPDYLVVRPNDRVIAEWLRLVMKSNWFVGEMTSRLRGIGTTDTGAVRTPRINASDIGEIRISLPSTHDQMQTADALERSAQRTRELEFRAGAMIELLQERRQALISAAVTGHIDVGGAF